MDSIGLQVGLLLALLFLLERLASARGWAGFWLGGVPVLTWVVVTAMALWCEAVIAFVVVHLLYFVLGTDVATAGFVITAVLLIATPVVIALALRRGTQRPSLHN